MEQLLSMQEVRHLAVAVAAEVVVETSGLL
jgi:hypothetical protein